MFLYPIRTFFFFLLLISLRVDYIWTGGDDGKVGGNGTTAVRKEEKESDDLTCVRMSVRYIYYRAAIV